VVPETTPAGRGLRVRLVTSLAVIGLLTAHYALAARSLVEENPTVDEVVHLPAGVTYWQQGTFRLYHHNPPLFKLVAALPVVLARPVTEPLYTLQSWRSPDPSPTTFSQSFARFNIPRYFELFQLARLTMPIFSIIGGLVVFAWSARLYGNGAGLLSLALWVSCPNILAHARLITSDVCSTALGAGATYVFWRYLQRPTWRWAAAAGLALGLAQLSKFSMLLLYAIWPFLWLVRLGLAGIPADALGRPSRGILRFLGQALAQGAAIVAVSILTIDAGYFFEGVGIPLGKFEFGSRTLTRPLTSDLVRPRSKNLLYDTAWQFRINRFRDTWLGRLPSPWPEHYLLGFDEQKIETEGIPQRFVKAVRTNTVAEERLRPETAHEVKDAYAVYLNGVLRRTGWWDYYLRALLYKVPEGTWILVGLSLVTLVLVRRSRAEWFDEIALGTVPVVILFSMTVLTDINLGLRYVLAILPYVFISVGKVVPGCLSLRRPWRFAAGFLVAGSLGLTIGASVWIHPHYLAYFNWASGGPDRSPPRLIDSNLDWGQDLVALQKWWRETIPNEPIGLAYFGQINPSIFAMRGEAFAWFLPPVRPGTTSQLPGQTRAPLIGPARTLTPGYYAVSATLLYGLPWRLYDPAPQAWEPAWNAHGLEPDTHDFAAFDYFREFQPIMPPIGHSIYVYHLTEADVARVAAKLEGAAS